MGSTGRATSGSVSSDSDDLLERIDYDESRKYKIFRGVEATGGWREGMEYTGSGEDTERWFHDHSNAEELESEMSDAEITAWHRWSNGTYMDGELYRPYSQLSDTAKRDIKVYDKYLDRATLHESARVVRRSDAQMLLGKGERSATLEQIQALRGRVIKANAPMSSGAASTGLRIGSSKASKPVEYRYHIAGGTTGAGMYIGRQSETLTGWGRRQREFVINRDTYWAIGSSWYDEKKDAIVVNMYYTGRGRHKY